MNTAISAVEAAKASRRIPRFTVVSACYNVERYLGDFIASIEAQSMPLDQLEVIAVDDGSTDDSLVTLKAWEARQPDLVTIISKANGGQGSARNLGIEHAHGEWVTFVDPDDMLPPDYFTEVDAFIRGHDGAAMIATNRILFLEATGETVNRHPLRRMFGRGSRVVDIERFPEYFHGSAPSAFFRTQVVREAKLRFDDRIQPNFEDGHFCARYILAAASSMVGFVSTAQYIYRKRADQSSTLQTGLMHPGRYVSVPRFGYLDLLQRAKREANQIPEWLQNLVLYELSYYFSADSAANGTATAAHGDTAREFVKTLKQIAMLIDPHVIESFNIRRFDHAWRDIMIYGLRSEHWCMSSAVVRRYDADKNEFEVVYRYAGPPPDEVVTLRGVPVTPKHGKHRSYIFFEHVLLHERILWVSAKGTLRIYVNGAPMPLVRSWPAHASSRSRPSQLKAWFNPANGTTAEKVQRTARDRALVRLANSRLVRRVFGNAWVIMDRIHDADDNGERLFRYLRKHRRDINAWFVIERGTHDWRRLKHDGYKRVVPHGSLRWELLMLNCKHLISSHADVPVHRPPRILQLIEPRWRFSFLQHGVIKDDLSAWLNGKRIDLFVTSTQAEYQSIVGDGTPYVFTSKETRLTGLPRFDRLREVGASIGIEQRDLILVCPTWRYWLNLPLAVGTQRRILTDDFLGSEYVEQWLAFLSDDRLRRLADDQNLRIGFLPHPNTQPALASMSLPSHVQALSFENQDVQRLTASAAVMVTDYSSMAFNAAYIDRPVVYFQFDADRVLGGGHVGRGGYFEYSRDGFGPVTTVADEAVAEVERIVIAGGRAPGVEYQNRIDATFPQRDGNCCKRVVKAIEDLTR